MTKMSNCMLFFTVITGAFVGTIAINYCNIKICERYGMHTMCKYTSPAPAQKCGEWRDAGLTDAEKKTIVDLHNELRRKVAAGKETRGRPGPQPAAVNIPDLAWDNELEMIAQRWANQCIPGHDKCRAVERFDVGQNFGWQGTFGKGFPSPPVNPIVEEWYNEVDNFDRKHVSNFPKDVPDIGHYVQVIHADTKRIGCGKITYKGLSDSHEINQMICNYGPGGNIPGQPIYKIKQ